MKTAPKTPKSLIKKTSSASGSFGFSEEESRYFNQMLKKFKGNLDDALDAFKVKYGHTGNY